MAPMMLSPMARSRRGAQVCMHALQSSIQPRVSAYGTRNCISWGRIRRRNGEPNARSPNSGLRPDHASQKVEQAGYGNEPSLRERMWQERMEQIRRSVDENPYEALFGWSNRMRMGVQSGRARHSWPLDAPRWWKQELDGTKDAAFHGQKIYLHGKASSPDLSSKTSASTNASPESPATATDSSSKSQTENLKYDPISNRMIRKGEELVGRSGQGPDAPLSFPLKSQRPANRAATDAPGGRKNTPSFMMLKQEPAESQPRPTESTTASQSDVRAEYQRYKAQRLPESVLTAQGDWLVQQGFLSGNQTTKRNINSSGISGKCPPRQSTLEGKYEQVHSSEIGSSQDRLVGIKPWQVQSKRIKITDAQKAAERSARQEILQYNLEVAKSNNTDTTTQKTIVARMNKFLHSVPILEPWWKQNGSKTSEGATTTTPGVQTGGSIETSLQRRSALKSAIDSSSLQTALQRHNKSVREITQSPTAQDVSEQPTRTHDPVGYDHAKESQRVEACASRVTTLDAQLSKEEQEVALKGIKESVVDASSPVQSDVSIPGKRLGESEKRTPHASETMETERTSGEPENSRPDPKLLRTDAEAIEDVPKPQLDLLPGTREGRDAEIAELLRYSKASQKPASLIEHPKENISMTVGVDAENNISRQVEEDNSLARSDGTIAGTVQNEHRRTVCLPNATIEKTLAHDSEVIRQIRDIYESAYGEITTKHCQEEYIPASVSASSTPQSTTPKNPPPRDAHISYSTPHSPSPPAPTALPLASSVKTLEPVTYVFLAHDSERNKITKVFIQEPPGNPSEMPISLTGLLRRLFNASKYLPHLQTLMNKGFKPVSGDDCGILLRKYDDSLPSSTITSSVINSVDISSISASDTASKPVAITTGTTAATDMTRDFIPSEGTRVPSSDSAESANSRHLEALLSELRAGPGKDQARRPRRLEPVFSGNSKNGGSHWRQHFKQQKQQKRMERRRKFRTMLKTIGILGVVGAATLYVAGVSQEMRKVVVGGRQED